MGELQRLKWRKEVDRFVAYPTATDHEQRYAEIRLHSTGYNTDVLPYGPTQHWLWRVRWDGWFAEHGFWPDKQGAADKATDAWWRCVQTEPPRNIDLEAAMVVARPPVQPVPNSLFAEDAEFLRKVMWHLHRAYGEEIAAEHPVLSNLYRQISSEFARRRESGEIPDQPKGEAISGGYRRRRRR